MSAIQIQSLLQPPSHGKAVETTLHLLNDRFKSLDQLTQDDALDTLLDLTRGSKEELNSKLAESQARINVLISETRTLADQHRTSAQELSLLRHSLADELASLTEELLSTSRDAEEGPTLLEEIEALHRSLKELEGVKSYVQIIERALKLSSNAVKQIQTIAPGQISEASVTEYKSLQAFVASVKQLCSDVEDGTGQGVKLLNFLDGVRQRTWSDIRSALSSTLVTAAEKLQWPLGIDYAAAAPEDKSAFEAAFCNLLSLQDINEKLHAEISAEKSSKDGIYPLQALVQPVALRFKYHFDGTRQTNRLDKPEWYFTHILNVSQEHRPFLDSIVQALIQAHSHKAINAWREFTRLLLPILTRKIRRTVPALVSHPSLLAHTVYQALAFDSSLREAGFGLVATTTPPPNKGSAEESRSEEGCEWEGMSDVILGQQEWFDAWLEGEKKFAEDQYHEIISAPNAWHIVDDAGEEAPTDHNLRPTNSARRMKALIEQITNRYRSLPRKLHKTRFLTSVQFPLLELYHTRISESLDAFETLSFFLVRAVPGSLAGQTGSETDTRRMTSGVEGVQRLVKALVSARSIAVAMETWGEDVFFLELWTAICENAWLRARVEGHAALPDPSGDAVEDTVFGDLVGQYTKLAERAESMIVRQICGEVEADLKNHFYRRNEHPELEGPTDEMYISPTLAAPLARLSAHLAFLHKTLPSALVTSLYRRAATPIATHILARSVMYRGRAHMNTRDARAVRDEGTLWLEACRLALGQSVRRVEGPWVRLLDAGRLLAIEGEAFERVVNVVFIGADREYDVLMEEIGVREMTREEVADVVRLREDCHRY